MSHYYLKRTGNSKVECVGFKRQLSNWGFFLLNIFVIFIVLLVITVISDVT